MSDQSDTTLMVLGHGSSKHTESSASVRSHAKLLSQTNKYADVQVAFLKEDPLIESCLDNIKTARVTIVPDFLAEGYFTRQVIPRILNLSERKNSIQCSPPVGTHPMMSELLNDAAEQVMGDWKPQDTSLFVVGHGSVKNSCSKQTMLHHLASLRQAACWAQVTDLWLEESPKVSEWHDLCNETKVIVVPYLLNDGQHGGWDIPIDLGLGRGSLVHGVTHILGGRNVRIAPALGTSPRFAEAVDAFAKMWGAASEPQ